MQVKFGLFPVLVLTWAGTAYSQSTEQRNPEQLQALLQCRSISEADARLQCYDRTVASFAEATEAGTVVVVDQEAIRRTRRSLFGLSLPSLPFLGGGGDSDAPSQIEAAIRSVSSFDHGKWLITLEDGAVWQTTEANTRIGDPRPGATATIRKGSLGGYFISWPGGRGISARRIR